MSAAQHDCTYCGKLFIRENAQRRRTKDHIVPRSMGGPTEPWNIVYACYQCNRLKKSMPLDQFIRMYEKGLNGYKTFTLLKVCKRIEQRQGISLAVETVIGLVNEGFTPLPFDHRYWENPRPMFVSELTEQAEAA